MASRTRNLTDQPSAIARADALAALCRSHGVELLYAFGSRAAELAAWLSGTVGGLAPGPSDADIAALFPYDQRPSMRAKVQLAQALEDLLGVRRVDLVSLRDADPFLAANVIRGERLYASDAHSADEYELFVLRRAGDCAPLERERLALILEGPR